MVKRPKPVKQRAPSKRLPEPVCEPPLDYELTKPAFPPMPKPKNWRDKILTWLNEHLL